MPATQFLEDRDRLPQAGRIFQQRDDSSLSQTSAKGIGPAVPGASSSGWECRGSFFKAIGGGRAEAGLRPGKWPADACDASS